MWWLGDASDVYHVIPVLNFQDFSGNNFQGLLYNFLERWDGIFGGWGEEVFKFSSEIFLDFSSDNFWRQGGLCVGWGAADVYHVIFVQNFLDFFKNEGQLHILFLRDRVEYVVAGGCRGCLPCNSCQPSVERIASSLPSFQFCLFVLSPFSQQSEQSFYENPDIFYFVLFPAVLWVLKWLGSTCDVWHLGLYEK